MAYGAGKYDDECSRIRNELKAEGVMLVVIGGPKGSGFSCQASAWDLPRFASVMRNAADQLDADLQMPPPGDAIKPREY
jgi:hypothetical protein